MDKNNFDYYATPDQKVFDEIKEEAIQIWRGYSDEHGYASGKINKVKSIENIKDNAWFIVAMFDTHNQAKLLSRVSPETAQQIRFARGY